MGFDIVERRMTMSSIAGSVLPADSLQTVRWMRLKTAGVLAAAGVATAVLVMLNTRYAEWIQALVSTDSPVVMGLLFSAFPLVIGGAVIAWRPRLIGLQLGSTQREWPLVLGITAGMCALAGVALFLVGTNPFRGSSFIVQVIAVPVSEEVMFRGAVFTLVLLALSRIHPIHRATVLAVVISGLVFGLAHLNNLGSYDPTFVVLQSVYATVLGLCAGTLRAVTGSLLPPILMHAAVNLVALLV
jgi:membrane protease YdiL (CAAX protease family)